MPSHPSSLGKYPVECELGRGGMGIVYLARDPRLNRKIAIKVLPDTLAHDPAHLARLEREATLLAALNHPNIAAIHGIESLPDEGGHVLLLEYVPGDTLADRIARGPMPRSEALGICIQIASALEAAHESGIIHRDLKPANIKVRDDGTVKVLDFGLAKAVEAPAGGASVGSPGSGPARAGSSAMPTMTSPAMTQQGVVLGTAAYMSPDQARGRPVDKRADIWALGAVLFEMLTGSMAFGGDTVTDVLASVVTREPDWSRLPAETPAPVRRLLGRCLEKDVRRRLRDAADVRLEIEDALTASDAQGVTTVGATPSRRSEWLLALGAALILGAAAGLLVGRQSATTEHPQRALALIAPAATLHVSISPDGRWLAATTFEGPVYVRRIDETGWRELGATVFSGSSLFWSADSREIGFASGTALKRIDLVGSRAQTICDPCVAPGSLRGASWNQSGDILISGGTADVSGGLLTIRDTGGPITKVTELDPSRGESSHRFPVFLPDGRHFLFTVRRDNGEHEIRWASLDGGAPRTVASGFSQMAYSAGHVLFVRNQALVAQPIDATTGRASGDPVTIADGVSHDVAVGRAAFSVANDGTVAYGSAPDSVGLRWLSRSGEPLGALTTVQSGNIYRVSRDGGRVVTHLFDLEKASSDIYVVDVETGARTRLTSDAGWDEGPVWSPDGQQVAYRSSRGPLGLYIQNSAGGAERLLIEQEGPDRIDVEDWSPDGTHLLVNRWTAETANDLMLVPTAATASAALTPWMFSKASETDGRFSPDGRFVAYTSDESGSTEVHVRAFEHPDLARRITTAGGRYPVWSHDGRELFYVDAERWVVAVPVRLGSTIDPGAPTRLFRKALREFNSGIDVDHQGRFLDYVIESRRSTPELTVFNIVLNWPARLRASR